MTVIIPPDYHAQKALENNRVICISEGEAVKADIRPLRIGILNIMPEAKSYEFSLLQPLGRSVLQIIPVWIKLKSHKYRSTQKSHLDKLYVQFEEAIKNDPLDGLVLTGAPVEHLEFEDITYWQEIKELLTTCRRIVPSTLGICWGAMALAKLLGLEKTNYKTKQFGVYETINLQKDHRITGSLDDRFWMPQSRFAGYNNQHLEQARDKGIINLLAKTVGLDYPIFESYDSRYLMNLGHLEYEPNRLLEEYNRDKTNNVMTKKPYNFDEDHLTNIWRCQRNEFFQQWLRFCHEETHQQKAKTFI